MDISTLPTRMVRALPAIEDWITRTVDAHRHSATRVQSLDFVKAMSRWIDESIIADTSVVNVARLPFPPLSAMGLPEFAPMEQLINDPRMIGITFLDTFFLRGGGPSTYFHELVHVVQWKYLGPRRFLLTYGIGLAQHGYRDSPLEQTAYLLQSNFEHGRLPGDVTAKIRAEAESAWRDVEPSFAGKELAWRPA